MLPRTLQNQILSALDRQPAVALLGPRQVGKTTLARAIPSTRPVMYLDLEAVADRAKLADPVTFMRAHPDALMILDEIQRLPNLFASLRGVIDEERRTGRGQGRFFMRGAAYRDFLRQSSESLAGRISFLELGPFAASEIGAEEASQQRLWQRGGFPGSFLAKDSASSLAWRQDFIRTYLERDVPLLGPRVPAETLRRLWTMLAHTQGASLNASRTAAGLGISNVTVGRYVDLLVDLLLLRRLAPWVRNVGKRLVKAPKIYIRDSGLVHALLNIGTFDALLGHPVVGMSWEGHVLENISSVLPFGAQMFFYRTASGEEIDLLVAFPSQQLWAIEVKRSLAPKVEAGFHAACERLNPTQRWVVYPGSDTFSLGNDVLAIGLPAMMQKMSSGR